MTTKALYVTSMGGDLLPTGPILEFARTSGDILTATAHSLETGAGPYKVQNNVADAPSGLVVALPSSATLTATNPIATDVVTIAGKVYTFIATPAADGDVDVGAATTVGTAKSMINLAAAINRDLVAAAGTYDLDTVGNPTVKAVLQDVAATTILKIEAITLDAAIGDAITLTSDDATIVASAGTLGSGASGTDYFIIRLDANTFSLATTKVLAEAGTAVTLADAGTGINTLVQTVETLAEAMENVVVGWLTRNSSRVIEAAYNVPKFWQAMIDGSILGDID